MPQSIAEWIQDEFEPNGALHGGDWDQWVNAFLKRLAAQKWFDARHEQWWHAAAQRTLKRMLQQQRTPAARSSRSPGTEQWLEDGLQLIFFDPEVVEMIYSPHEQYSPEWVNHGADFHCRWTESVVKSLVYRHAAMAQQLSVQPDNLIDELWGMVMEETVLCLTDAAAHVYGQDGKQQSYPPSGTRGRRRGNILRVAIAQDGTVAAGYRIDHQLLVWDTEKNQSLLQLDTKHLFGKEPVDDPPVLMLFSNNPTRLALEWPNQQIVVIGLDEPNREIQWFDPTQKRSFLQLFGEIQMNSVRSLNTQPKQQWIEPYIKNVLDWAVSAEGSVLVTASRRSRRMPDWMRQAGFDRSIRHIAKKRLIDLIRKYSHTAYACWRCGSMQSANTDTSCRHCGADFTACPVGCRDPVFASDYWQCQSCGQYTRLYQAYQQAEPEWMERIADTPGKRFQDELDYQKIMDVMSRVFVTHKKRSIPCADLIRFKAEGLTNEAIGEELHIPRGTVDYLWNRCKEQIQQHFGFLQS